VRVNGDRVGKAAQLVGPGDVLTFSQGQDVRVIRIAALGERRGPAPEAQALYCDLAPPAETHQPSARAPGFDGKGRPSKQDRRAWDLSRRQTLE
jgi:ribosome-associated heat shock protein Hsp15